MKKSVIVVLTILIVLAVSIPFFGTSTKPEEEKELTIAYCPGIEDPFMRMIEKGARKKADELGVASTCSWWFQPRLTR
jgi:ABC-type sugar transport system substrate-binding protein